MTPEAQKIAITKACAAIAMIGVAGVPVWRDCYEYSESSSSPHRIEFNPLEDLNAMHEAEKVLTREQQHIYLSQINQQQNETARASNDWFKLEPFWHVHATAAQRAEAFLKTLKLWDDSK